MRSLLVVLAFVAAACSSTSSVETGPVTDSSMADARRRSEVHTALAGEYYSRGNYPIAILEARLALKDDSTYYAAHNMLGLVLMELREDTQARASFTRALQLAPNNAEVLNNYGWFLCLRNEAPRGLEMMRKASADTLYPTPEKAWFSIGLCLRRQGQIVEAEEALRRAIQIRPDMIGALYNLAQLTYESGKVKDAETYFNRYSRMANPNLEALVLGVKIARANNDPVAEDSFMQQLRRRFPDSTELRELEARK